MVLCDNREAVMTTHNGAGERYGFFFIAAIFFFLIPGALASLHAQTAQDVVASVEGHYRNVKDLTAHVVQSNVLRSIGKTQKYEGKLFIRKPGKLRLEYTNGQLILIDGANALFYSKKSEQVVKKAFTDFERMNIPVAFLLGAAHIRDDFESVQADPRTPLVLELLPKKTGAAMKKLRLSTDGSGRINTLMIFDRSGNTTEVAFTDIREDTGVDEKQFTFTAPKGTEIIE
jgi:outer membrane lipoprotein carrier protein